MSLIDPAQLGRWFDEHASFLLLYARQFGSGASSGRVAEDLVQDVFIRLLEQRVAPENVRAWLCAALRNAAISQGRSTRRRMNREERFVIGRQKWFESRPDDLLDAAAAQEALSHLPQLQREIVTLRIWGQLTLAQVAQTLAMPLSSVHDKYKAALAAIRVQMERPCPKTTKT